MPQRIDRSGNIRRAAARWLPRACMMGLLVASLAANQNATVPLRDVAPVMGTGVDQASRGRYRYAFEILSASNSTAATNASEEQGKGLVLGSTGVNLYDAVSELAASVKRYPVFSHNRVWILSRRVATVNWWAPIESMERSLSSPSRSYLFVSDIDPAAILSSAPNLDGLPSSELAIGMRAARFTTKYVTPTLQYCLAQATEPVGTFWVPNVTLQSDKGKKPMAVIDGSSLFLRHRMLGTVGMRESFVLLLLQDRLRAGTLLLPTPSDKTAQIVLTDIHMSVKPSFRGRRLSVRVTGDAEGRMVYLPPGERSKPGWRSSLEKETNRRLTDVARNTLYGLQKRFHVDYLDIGNQLYHWQPSVWKSVRSGWNERMDHAVWIVSISVHIREGRSEPRALL